MTLFTWSKTAADNDDADSSINAREGWAPSIVNNSIRALMAAVAKWRDDESGNLVTGGTGTAYTLTTNQSYTSLSDGLTVTCRLNVASGATPTLNVDSLGAKSIASVYGTAIPTGALASGGVYRFTYDQTDDKWIVNGRFADMVTTNNFSTSYPDLNAIEAISGTDGVLRKTDANTWALDDGTTNLMFVHDNVGNEVETGIKGDIHVPFACTITEVRLFADQTGSIVVDLWKDTYANYPPTDADSITASAVPTISAATKSEDTTLSGWTTSVAAGDVIRVNVDSVTDVTRFTLALTVKRFI